MAAPTDTKIELSTDGGRGGSNAPRATAGGGQVATAAVADQQAEGARAAPAGRPAPYSAGLVRLETSDTPIVGRYAWLREEQQRRRRLHMFKSLSCVGDMLMEQRADDGRELARAFLTFTYRPGVEWQPRHLTECLKRMRHWVERRGVRFRYLWVAEQHKSGRVHYHAIVWLPRGLTTPKGPVSEGLPTARSRRSRSRTARLSLLVDASEVSTRTLRACRSRAPNSRWRLALSCYRRVVGVSCLLPRRLAAAVRPSLLAIRLLSTLGGRSEAVRSVPKLGTGASIERANSVLRSPWRGSGIGYQALHLYLLL